MAQYHVQMSPTLKYMYFKLIPLICVIILMFKSLKNFFFTTNQDTPKLVKDHKMAFKIYFKCIMSKLFRKLEYSRLDKNCDVTT